MLLHKLRFQTPTSTTLGINQHKKRHVHAMRAKSIAKNPEEFCFFRASYSEPVLTIRWERKNALDLIAAGGPG